MRIYQYILLIILLLVIGKILAQPETGRSRISGIVIDARTNEPVSRVPFEALPFKREVKTDKNGKFLLNIPKGSQITLSFDYYPFDKQEITLNTQSDTLLTILLTSPFTSKYLEEVEVIASKPVNDKPASVERLDKRLFLTLPALMGERDVVKALSITAGVSSSSEASADIQVRGGTHGQNLFLLNDVPLYFTQHALGLTSSYNPTIIQSAEFYKAAFPARHGGKIASILAVKTVEPSLSLWNGEFELGILSSKAMLNIPLQREKLGIYLSSRISNFSPLLGLANTFTSKNDTRIGIAFSDINAGMRYKISEKDELSMDFFRVADSWNIKQKDFNDLTALKKNNSQTNLSLHWKRNLNEQGENKLLLYADYFISGQLNSTESDIKGFPKLYSEYGFNTAITTVNISDYFQKRLSENLKLMLGGSLRTVFISPLRFNSSENPEQKPVSSPVQPYYDGNVFTEFKAALSSSQSIDLGIRLSAFGRDKTFWTVEPRASYLLQLSRNYSISASVSRMSQPIHRVANPGIGIPMEIFIPATETLKPEKSWIGSLGVGKEIFMTNYRITVKTDMWFKSLSNIVEFRNGMDAYAVLMKGHDVHSPHQQVVTSGKGRAYGIDFSLSFNQSRSTWVADYTLMRAINRFDELNDGQPFAASTDIRNSLSLTWSYKFKHNILLSANCQFYSGRPITVPTNVLPSPTIDLDENELLLNNDISPFIYLYTKRNNYRTRAFHKLDVSLTKNFLLKRKYQSSFTLGLYNTYNQANPFTYSLSIKKEANGTLRPVLNSVSVFPILPSFSWRIKF